LAGFKTPLKAVARRSIPNSVNPPPSAGKSQEAWVLKIELSSSKNKKIVRALISEKIPFPVSALFNNFSCCMIYTFITGQISANQQ